MKMLRGTLHPRQWQEEREGSKGRVVMGMGQENVGAGPWEI